MTRRILLTILAQAMFVIWVNFIPAQSKPIASTERRSRNRPILRIQSEVPTAHVTCLAFANTEAGHTTLYAGGEDKVVRQWKIEPSSNGRFVLESGTPIRWPIYRNLRGRINAIDVLAGGRGNRQQSNAHIISFAGTGVKTSQVNYLTTDRPDEQRVLIDSGTSLRQSVWSVAIHPAGSHIFVGEESMKGAAANLLLWDLKQPEVPRVARIQTKLLNVQFVATTPNGKYVAIAGPDVELGVFRVQLWEFEAIRSAIVPTDDKTDVQPDQLITPVPPLQEYTIRSHVPRTVRGLGWLDDTRWAIGTCLGIISGNVNSEVLPANPFDIDAGTGEQFVEGKVFRPHPKGASARLTNRHIVPIEFQYSTSAESETLQWSAKQVLSLGESKTFRQPQVSVRIRNNGVWQNPPAIIPAPYELEYRPSVSAMHIIPDHGTVAAVEAIDYHRLLIRESDAREWIELRTADTDTTFTEIVCVALSDDGRFVAAAGPARVRRGNRDFTIYQISIWETATAKLVANIPKLRPSDSAPAVGGQIVNVNIVRNKNKQDELQFQLGHFDRYGGATACDKLFRPTLRLAGIRNVQLTGAGPEVFDAKDGRLQLPLAGEQLVVVSAAQTKVMDGTRVTGTVVKGQTFKASRRRSGWVEITPVNGSVGWVPEQLTEPMVQGQAASDKGKALRAWWFLDGDQKAIGPCLVPASNQPTVGLVFEKSGRRLLGVGLHDGIEIHDVEGIGNKRGRSAVLRSFYGHDAQVTCLDAAEDGTWLASGSTDGTICAWNLDGLDQRAELGVLLDSNLTVKQVQHGSPGWEAGFTTGQRIDKVVAAGRTVSARQMRSQIEHPVPGEELLVTVTDANAKFNLQTPVRRDPLWTFYPRHDGEWVMWTPDGIYDQSELDEDQPKTLAANENQQKFEWVVNRGTYGSGLASLRAGAVNMPALDFESQYRNPVRLNTIIKTRKPLRTETPLAPDMEIQIRDQSANFKVTTSSRHDRVHERSVWLNGQLLKIDKQPVSDLASVQLPAEAIRTGQNVVIGLAVVERNGQRFFFRRLAQFDSKNDNRTITPRLHFLGIGVGHFAANFEKELSHRGLQSLRYPGRDVIAVRDALLKQSSGLANLATPVNGIDTRGYSQQSSRFVRALAENADASPTRANILQSLKELIRTASPDDIAVVMLAGHGFVDSRSETFYFAARDGLVSQSELDQELSRLPCRTLMVLDTCHSEAVAGMREQILQFSRILTGPIVLTACGRDEESEESDDVGHGVFTAAILEGLNGEWYPKSKRPGSPELDTNADNIVSINELCRFVRWRTPGILNELLLDQRQNPQLIESANFPDSQRFPIRLNLANESAK